MATAIAWLLGLKHATSIDGIDLSLAAPWAAERPFWMFFGVVCLFAASMLFYLRLQPRGTWGARAALGASRGLLLALVFVTLADPMLKVSLRNLESPLVYLIFDGTESMAIEDAFPENERSALARAVGLEPADDSSTRIPRIAYVQALLRKREDNLLRRLCEEKRYRVEAFLFDGNTTSQLRKLDAGVEGKPDPARLARQLTTRGQVTALGAVLRDAGSQFGAGRLAAVVLFSDFAHNSGMAPVGSPNGRARSPAASLGVPIFTVGIGAIESMDLAVDLRTDPRMKRAERTSIAVTVRQSGLVDRAVTVELTATQLSRESGRGGGEIPIGRKTVTLALPAQTIDFPFTPQDAGRFRFTARVAPVEGEAVEENNRATRDVNIIDDYLRLMYVAYEPTWEWRFVKEVFHRDRLIGMRGFRTYLASSDPRVRESNILFLPTLAPQRSAFFANDVIFLDDMPRGALNDRFCQMVEEFVGRFGGGLVVLAGPRFGPAELCGTALEHTLPVILDPDARLRDDRPFRLRPTPHASRYPFMRLGDSDAENARAWNNLRRLPWYQPVAQLHEQAHALAEHPSDRCRDGKTPQPLIAIRPYGAGEVVYLGFNEMWRLRRLYGDRYYRRFWSQLIYRLGMSHALGSEKRFVVRTDRRQYRAEDKVTLTVEAYDENFEPLKDDVLPDRALHAELRLPGKDGERTLAVPLLRQGVFEARIPVFAPGEYSVRVQDPVTGRRSEARFQVTDLSAERRSSVRNVRLQNQLAAETNGKSYDLTTVAKLADDLQLESLTESVTRNHRLWSTPLWFIALVGLMLGEWLIRKMIRLA